MLVHNQLLGNEIYNIGAKAKEVSHKQSGEVVESYRCTCLQNIVHDHQTVEGCMHSNKGLHIQLQFTYRLVIITHD